MTILRLEKFSIRGRKLHQILGLLSGLFLFIIAFTGLLLNHSDALKLREKKTNVQWLMAIYGLIPEGEPLSYIMGRNWVSFWENRLFFNGERVVVTEGLIGLIEFEDYYIAASPESLYLISRQGKLIEILGSEFLPDGEIKAVGLTVNGRAFAKIEQDFFIFDDDIISFARTHQNLEITDPVSSATPDKIRRLILKDLLGEGISWHKIIFDLHSFRIFGTAGLWLNDILALALIFLVFSGFITSLHFRYWNNHR